MFSLETGAGTRIHDTRLSAHCTHTTVGSNVGAAEHSMYLPGLNLMPSKALFGINFQENA